jgi:hypothetical protein
VPSQPAASPERAGASAPVDGGQPSGEGGNAPEQHAEAGEGEGVQPPKPTPEHRTVQGRISEYQKRARQAELNAAEERGRRLALEDALRNGGAKPRDEAPPAPVKPAGPPDPKSYPQGEYDPRYAADLAKFEIREEARVESENAARAEREAAAQAQIQQGFGRLEDTLAQADAIADGEGGEFFSNAPEFLRQAARALPTSVVDCITESEHRVHVAEILGRGGLKDDPADMARLRSMSPTQAARYIAKIDARVGASLASRQQASAASPRPAPQPSPAPIPTVTPSGAAPSFDPNKGSMEDFVRWRNGG